MGSNARTDKRGFALPAVLAVTGVVTLIFLVAITALASLTAEARSARDRVRFTTQAMSAEATLAYVAATEPLQSGGFAVGSVRVQDEFSSDTSVEGTDRGSADGTTVRLDGRSYALDGAHPVVLQIQDQGGLINLSALGVDALPRLLERLGVPQSQFGAIAARYTDYVDSDDLTAPGGAEASQYDVGEPANRDLRRPTEWLSVLGLREAVDPAAWRAVRGRLAADSTQRALNVNAMDTEALQVLMGLSEQQAEAVIRAREAAPFRSFTDFLAVGGGPPPLDTEQTYTFPSGRILYTIRDTRSPWVYRGRITLTPYSIEQPMWIDQTEQTEAPGRAATRVADAVPFPYASR